VADGGHYVPLRAKVLPPSPSHGAGGVCCSHAITITSGKLVPEAGASRTAMPGMEKLSGSAEALNEVVPLYRVAAAPGRGFAGYHRSTVARIRPRRGSLGRIEAQHVDLSMLDRVNAGP